MIRKIASGAALIAALTGCGAGASGGAESATQAPTPSPTPTIAYATEQQVASVIARYETDWREVIDGAGECRLYYVLYPDDPKGWTCWLDEQTIVLTASSAVRDLSTLVVPPSMESIVRETKATLWPIANSGLTNVCGESVTTPADTDECNQALGGLFSDYSRLEDQLDAWAPYL